MRIRLLASAALAAAAVSLCAHPAAAQQHESFGIRAQGMGGAFVAMADDASASWWNPAGLASGAYLDSLVEYGVLTEPEELRNASGALQPSVETRTRAVAFAFPAMGLSYYRLQISELQPIPTTAQQAPSRQDQGAPGVRLRSFVVSQWGATVGQSLSSNLVVASTLKLMRGSVVTGQGLDADASFKQVHELEGETDTRLDLDIGALAILGVARVGLSVKNVRTPEFGPEGDSEELARRIRLGGAVMTTPGGKLDQLAVAFDADLTRAPGPLGTETKNIAGGIEAWMFNRRAGFRAGMSTNTIGERQWRPSYGASLAFRPGTYLEGQYTAGPDKTRRGWGFDMRLTF